MRHKIIHSFSWRVLQVENASVSKPLISNERIHFDILNAFFNKSEINFEFLSADWILSKDLKQKFKYKSKVEIGGLNLFKKASDL